MTRGIRGLPGRVKRWMYRGGRPGAAARRLNDALGRRYGSGGFGARDRDVRLEIAGRVSGRVVGFPVVLADVDDSWYVVSMLGEDANWVRNLRAADGRAVIRHGREWEVRLVEIPVADRPRVLRRYVRVAPGGRPHIPVDHRRPVEDFVAVAADFPVFRVEGLTLTDLRRRRRLAR